MSGEICPWPDPLGVMGGPPGAQMEQLSCLEAKERPFASLPQLFIRAIPEQEE